MEETTISPDDIAEMQEELGVDFDSSYAGTMDMDGAAQMSEAGAMGMLFGFGFMMVFILIITIIVIIGLWKIFVKANQPGWAALIPIYNTYILLKIVRMSPWFLLVMIFGGMIPFVGGLIMLGLFAVVYYRLAKSFGKGVGYTLGLLFLSPIFMPMLGFGSAQYTALKDGIGVPDETPTPTPQQ